MDIDSWYKDNFEKRIHGRYITLEDVYPILDGYKNIFGITVPGTSEMGADLPLIKIGNGTKIVLGWSQMHGNESTTTKALFDFFKFISQRKTFQLEIELFLKTYTFYVFPILNPDGARLYTRENSNGVDLNRDAQRLSQKESQCLRKVFDQLAPSLCLNLHDQRSIYGFENGNPATVSFLSPAADQNRTVTSARKETMRQIVKMDAYLQKYIPLQVGRYDDSFNEACVGDTFQKAGVPTILFEAGHYKNDYQREKTRELIFYSLLVLFDIIGENHDHLDYKTYFDIPENCKNYNDIILRNARVKKGGPIISVAIQYAEVLQNGIIDFIPVIEEIGALETKVGHREIDCNGTVILSESQERLREGLNISRIVNEGDNFTINFQ